MPQPTHETLVGEKNLTEDRFHAELEQTDLFVTFFGSGFDIPHLQRAFSQPNFRSLHFDWCVAIQRLSLQGRLMALERELQIDAVHTTNLEPLVGLLDERMMVRNGPPSIVVSFRPLGTNEAVLP
ncbi:MAG TPA: ribonuclease H-like domain-containing protein [Nitrospira sp.]|nr:ribonuclease H-like domain-containing protein [Nitrospira sp.]